MLVRSISTVSSPVEIDLTPDFHLLSVTAAVAVVTAFAFGLVPALRAAGGAFYERGRGAVGESRRFRPGRGLAVLQIAVSFVLLLAAGLFVDTMRNLLNVDLGFRPDGVLPATVDL